MNYPLGANEDRNAPWNDTYEPEYCEECKTEMDVETDEWEKQTTYTCPECGHSFYV